MIPIAHHAGEQLILSAALGSGVVSCSLVFLRAGLARLARRRSRGQP